MIVQDRLVITPHEPILKQVLQALGLTYIQFAKRLDISVVTLEHYRRGTRQFKLNMRQFKTLVSVLAEVGLTIEDLPDDWILNRHNE